MVQAPAAEQVREGIHDDEVRVHPSGSSVHHQRLPGQHAEHATNPAAVDLADLDQRLERRAVEQPLLAIERFGGEPAGPRVGQAPRDGLRRGRRRGGEHGDGLEDRASGCRPAVRAAIEKADVYAFFHRLANGFAPAAKLQHNGSVLVLDPPVGMDPLESRQHQARRGEQRGRLRRHLGHHGERQDRQPTAVRLERRDPPAAQRMLIGDRIVAAVEPVGRLHLDAPDQPSDLAHPRPRLRAGDGRGVLRPAVGVLPEILERPDRRTRRVRSLDG